MKKIFPIITTLIFLSLLGIIFFQVLWINGAIKIEEQKFNEHIDFATAQVAEDLMEEKGNLLPISKKNSLLFQSDNLQPDIFKLTIAQKYSTDEVMQFIRNAFDKHHLKKVPFEFSISSTSIIGEDMVSTNFYKLQNDTINFTKHAIPLETPTGSMY